ncbi:unnamed protein product [Malus baccata var. baccata]
MRTETVIDLEAPVVVETDIYGEDSIERRRNDSPHGGLIRVAAEALVAISSFQTPNMQDNVTGHEMDSSQNDSLLWFAKTISSCVGNLDNGSAAEVKRTDSEESFPDVTDYFEHMTLNLVESGNQGRAALLCASKFTQPNRISDIVKAATKRSIKEREAAEGLQRDVFPGLVSLSRNEGEGAYGDFCSVYYCG